MRIVLHLTDAGELFVAAKVQELRREGRLPIETKIVMDVPRISVVISMRDGLCVIHDLSWRDHIKESSKSRCL